MTENFKFSPSRLPKIIKSFSGEIDEFFWENCRNLSKNKFFLTFFAFKKNGNQVYSMLKSLLIVSLFT